MATARDREASGKDGEPPQPGIEIVWSGDAPTLMTFEVGPGGVVLGRELLGGVTTDDRISRQHARLRWHRPSFSVVDLGSRNGTFVGGQPVVDGEITVIPPCVVRAGRTVGILVGDLGPVDGAEVRVSDDAVIGPTLAPIWDRIALGAGRSDTLLIEGEAGTGKELAARAFHRAAGVTGELVTVDCAALPAGQAEDSPVRRRAGHAGRRPRGRRLPGRGRRRDAPARRHRRARAGGAGPAGAGARDPRGAAAGGARAAPGVGADRGDLPARPPRRGRRRAHPRRPVPAAAPVRDPDPGPARTARGRAVAGGARDPAGDARARCPLDHGRGLPAPALARQHPRAASARSGARPTRPATPARRRSGPRTSTRRPA